MKNILLFLISVIMLPILVLSCDKKYTYVEINKEKSLVSSRVEEKEDEHEIIKAKNDSSAYADAYRRFCVSVYVNECMYRKSGHVYSVPVKFKLFNSAGDEVYIFDQSMRDEIIEWFSPFEISGVKISNEEFRDIMRKRYY